jgi:hypothetical protein
MFLFPKSLSQSVILVYCIHTSSKEGYAKERIEIRSNPLPVSSTDNTAENFDKILLTKGTRYVR